MADFSSDEVELILRFVSLILNRKNCYYKIIYA
jgi:hypothetical protein